MNIQEPTFKVYLAGPITGLTFGDAQDWRQYVMNKMDPRIKCYSPLRGKEYLAARGPLVGSYNEYPLSTATGITTRDRYDCMGSDAVIFNLLGAKQISVGTMIELGWADAARVPSILVIENPKPVGKDGWGHLQFPAGVTPNIHEHPMVRATTGFHVSNLDDAVKLTEIILLNKKTSKQCPICLSEDPKIHHIPCNRNVTGDGPITLCNDPWHFEQETEK